MSYLKMAKKAHQITYQTAITLSYHSHVFFTFFLFVQITYPKQCILDTPVESSSQSCKCCLVCTTPVWRRGFPLARIYRPERPQTWKLSCLSTQQPDKTFFWITTKPRRCDARRRTLYRLFRRSWPLTSPQRIH